MPFYTYSDGEHRVEQMRRMSARLDPLACPECGKAMELVMSLPHCPPDGIYSYAPNTGNAQTFDRKWEAMKAKKLSDGNE